MLVDENNRLTGLITIKDIDMMRRFPQAAKDRQGRLRVGAAVGVFDYERAGSLIGKDVDFLVVLMFAFSLLGIIVGYYFGRFFSLALPKRWPGVLSGVLLIAFGFYGLLS